MLINYFNLLQQAASEEKEFTVDEYGKIQDILCFS